jgi:septal ring factor EnvC (AmiA/AmiB activator)
MNIMIQRFLLFSALLVAANGFAAESKLSETRTTLEKWVETRQLISKTRADWQTDKETIEQSIALLERELKGVEDQMAKLNTNSSQADKERAQTEAAIKAANESLEPSQKFASEFEGQLTKFIPQLPQPLQDTLKPLLAKLPADSANTKMKATERIQVLVGVLNEIDKFNNAVNVFSEKRKNQGGAEVAVETVYVGLGSAYFVNDAGDFAGMGSPGAKGWEWTVKPDIAASVKEVVRIYRGERTAHFVGLPVVIR